MYCSSCGVAVTPNLTYCNHCGAKLNSEKTDTLVKTTEARFDSFIMSAMVGLFVTGLIAMSVLLGVMKAVLNFQFGPLLAFAFLSFLILIAIEGILISRLFRRRIDKSRTDKSESGADAIVHITKELEAQSRVVSEPAGSVTDHTTRTLDPIYNERR
jgi:putative copper export protein